VKEERIKEDSTNKMTYNIKQQDTRHKLTNGMSLENKGI